MPVRSLNSSVLRWPDAQAVKEAFRLWAKKIVHNDPNVVRVGYFGSYARGDAGPGSDIDIVIIVKNADKPFSRRGADWDLTSLPIPADVLVYTSLEWSELEEHSGMGRILRNETIWHNN
ncbi:nucleotidyltransferase domain-containing protein [Candidatus Sumerlaeota bacterium]|nr:nucleotidyltransferase domain-containing protein [Candidatus Sumerlaeota bacterium]